MNYYNHLKKESELPSLTQYCGVIAEQIQSLDHKNELNKAEQKKGAYQCLHCEFGSDCKGELSIICCLSLRGKFSLIFLIK